MEAMAPSPTFLTAVRPKRTPSGVTRKPIALALRSGASTGMPMSRHSPKYTASLSVFWASIVISEAMKCRG